MTRTAIFWTAVVCACWTAATGCLKSTHRIDGGVTVTLPESSWAVPLAEIEWSTDALPADFAAQLEAGGEGGAYVWRKALDPVSVGLGDWMVWEDWERQVAIGLESGTIAALNAMPAGAGLDLEVVEALPFELAAGTEVARVVFAEGTLRCMPQPAAGLQMGGTLTIPELLIEGQPVSWMVGSEAVELDLTGAELVLPTGQTDLHLTAQLALTTTGAPLHPKTSLGWSFAWQSTVLERFEGRLGEHAPLLATGELELTAPEFLEGPAGLGNPRLVLEVENGQGVALDLAFSGQIHPAATPFTWTPATSATIPSAAASGTPVASSFILDNQTTSPPIGTWLAPTTSGLSYTASATIADPGDALQFLVADGTFRLAPTLEVPFTGYASRLAYRDTVPCDLATVLATQLPPPLTTRDIARLTLRFETTNGMPFSLATQVRFLDAAGEAIDSLFVDATTTLEAATTTLQNGVHTPVAPGLRNWDAVFDGELAWALAEAGVQSMAIELIGCTPGAADQLPVAFGPGQTVSLRAALRVDAQLGQP